MLSHSPGARWVTIICRSHATGGQGERGEPSSRHGDRAGRGQAGEDPGGAPGEVMAATPILGGGWDKPRHSLRMTPSRSSVLWPFP